MKTAEELLDEYHANLLEVLKRDGELTDIDLVFCKPKLNLLVEAGNDLNKHSFIRVFNEVKALNRKGSLGHQTLTDLSERTLKKLKKKGFNLTDARRAIEAMYYEDGKGKSWAFRSGNDTPTHLLREGNFERYLNIYNHGTNREQSGINADSKNIEAKRRILGIG